MKRFLNIFFLVVVFITFFNGVADKGPSRRKFKHLESGEENLIKPEGPPPVDRLKEISGDKRFVNWKNWWQRCIPGFSLDSMEDLGEFPVDNEPLDPAVYGESNKGPSKILYIGSPNGKHYINPYWGRLVYRMKGEDWQAYLEDGCGAELYDPAKKRGAIILHCYTRDGLDGAFWLGNDRFVIMGYDAVTRQMNVECETVESCIAPSVWIVDLKSATFNQHRGSIARRGSCDLDGFLKLSMPKFFGE